ncbi:MAG: cysteine desulfurase [Anaerolineales bacterium]|nr:MAG: cysteine desulfurase [Anaerolineales bacterium]
MTLDVPKLQRDFPILQREEGGKRLVYLDNAASTHKPVPVLEALASFYSTSYANVHRGIYRLCEEATQAYEDAREKVGHFINAPSARGVVFTRNTTEAINLVAYAWGRANVRPGDRIVVTEMEHHSNMVPWQVLAREVGAELAYVRVTPEGRLDLESLDRELKGGAKLVAFAHVSNVLGTVNPAREIVDRSHDAGALVLIDAAQSVPHIEVDVGAIDCDFLAFSAHKMCGPTGIGVLYGRPELLESMPPFLTGGGMIQRVTLADASWNEVPWKFEAGTPAIAEAVGFGAAVDYLTAVGLDGIREHEVELTSYALERLAALDDVRVFGPSVEERVGVLPFAVEGIHPHDVAQVLDGEGVAVRAGVHCTQPLHRRMGLSGTTRASFYLYNTCDDVDRLAEGIGKAQAMLGGG